MKRLLLIAISALTASVCAYAGHLSEKELQFREYFPYKYEARIGWGGSPFGDMMTYGKGLFWRMSDVDYWDRDGYIPSLDNMYGTEGHAEYMTGVISAEFNFNLRHWVSISIEAGFNGIWGHRYDISNGKRKERINGVSFSLMPHVKGYWFNRKHVRLYTDFGIGLALGTFDGQFGLVPGVQYAPVCITAGNKIFFYLEPSIGTIYLGGKFGLGYRF